MIWGCKSAGRRAVPLLRQPGASRQWRCGDRAIGRPRRGDHYWSCGSRTELLLCAAARVWAPRPCYWTRGEPVWDGFRGVWTYPNIRVCE